MPTANASSVCKSLPWPWLIAITAVGIFVFFFRLDAFPLQPWDEARLANNAIEMVRNGHWLITTYDGQVDHLNTKPPFLIWVMAGAIHFFGANEWAVRLPSASSAFATCFMLFVFCYVRLGRPIAGFVAAVTLMGVASGYVQLHSARSGDYDAMLALWTTAYLLAAYLYLHSERYRNAALTVFTLCVALAFLTKTVQGLIFIPALIGYAIWQRRLSEILRTPSVYLAVACVIIICISYYVVRESLDPGYFSAVMKNDLLGRYTTVLDGREGRLFSYILQFKELPLAGPCVYFTLRRGGEEERRICRFALTQGLFYLFVISSASTKTAWYMVPLYPLFALLIGIGIAPFLRGNARLAKLSDVVRQRVVLLGCAILTAAVVALNLAVMDNYEKYLIDTVNYRYSHFLRSLPNTRPELKKFVIVDPGHPNYPNIFYVAPTLFYANVFRENGYKIAIIPPTERLPADYDTAVFCGEEVSAAVRRQTAFSPLFRSGDCGVFRLLSNAAETK